MTVRAPVATACPRCGATLATGASSCGGCGALATNAGGNPSEQGERIRARIQEQIGGAFRLLELLGRGGMGIVFRAHEVALDREVALKVLAIDPLLDPGAYERFEREAKLAARLDHPNIVPIFAVGQQASVAYYTMRLVRGGSVEQMLERGQPLGLDHALNILREVAAALDYAHAHGVVHRDVKPANILVGDTGHAQVADFGIAKALGSEATSHTATGVIGSPAYMAPEQWRGEPVDGRADQYALAIVAFEMLTGRRPFETPSVQDLMKMHLNGEVPDVTRLRPGLAPSADAAIRRALSKYPAERFANASAFVDMFAPRAGGATGAGPAYRTGQRPSYRPATRPTTLPRRRWRSTVGLLALAGVAAWLAADPIARHRARGAAERAVGAARSSADSFLARQMGRDLGDTTSAPTLDSLRRAADSLLALAADSTGAAPWAPPNDAPAITAPATDAVTPVSPGRRPVAMDTTSYGASPAPFRTVRTVNGYVRVIIHGGVARARVDGVSYGFTPAVIPLPPGVHFVTVDGAGDAFLPSQVPVTVSGDDTVTAEFSSRSRTSARAGQDTARDAAARDSAERDTTVRDTRPARQPPGDR